MKRVGQWNVFTSEDAISCDGHFGTATLKAMGINTGSITATGTVDHISVGNSVEIKPFKCPCCGGNSYKTLNGNIVCNYCDTEFLR